ncbi:MAG TPA: hypothetical protein V6D28_24080 [Leptolyngbyaceae cyanobacterium]
MSNAQKVREELSFVEPQSQVKLQKVPRDIFKKLTPKKLGGGLLLILGYLLSPLCWWNDLLFNLPIAYCFGYICSWLSSNLLLPGLIVGYWISNIAGILLMQIGTLEVFQGENEKRDFKKELLTGLISSTAYTLLILGLIQLKILDTPIFFSGK